RSAPDRHPGCDERRRRRWRSGPADLVGGRRGDIPSTASDARRNPLLVSPGMRIAVLSDIHANLAALEAVLADAGPVDGVWHLGDVVGYGPDPNGVVARLRDVGAIGVRGNHDAAACGGPEIDWFNADVRRAMEWTRTVIDGPSVEWLS